MKTLLILRGLPRSGKSTLAKHLMLHSVNAREVSLDLFIEQHGYFEDKMKEWAQACKDQCELYMQNEVELIIQHGVNAQGWSYTPYLDMAKEHGYTAFVLIVENFHGGTNNSIPVHKFNKMQDVFKIHI